MRCKAHPVCRRGTGRVLLPFSRRKKAVAARLRARGCTILFAARRAAGLGGFGCQTIDSILLPDTRQGKIRFRKRNAFRNAGRRLACEDFFRLATCRRQATYFFEREKVGKKRFSRLSGRGKRNRRRFRRRGSACVINSPAGRPRAFASYRSAIFMGHSVWGLSTEDRPADAGTSPPFGGGYQNGRPEAAGLRA